MADFINNLLEKFKSSSSEVIGVSVTQSGLLEVCKYDLSNNCICAYANRTIKYNFQNREITDYEEFRTNLLAMYQELNISNNCQVILSLPSVFFEITSVPLILDDFATENVLLGEVEQSYIFKQNEPIVSWIEAGQNERNENKTIIYSAIQRNEMESIQRAFDMIGSKLIAIDNSHYNLINAIPYTHIAQNEIENQSPWNVILITNNSFILCSMNGKRLIEYYEEPLALRSIDSVEEKYSILTESINHALGNYVANSILLISDSDDIDAEELCDTVSFHGKKSFLNQNKFASGQIVETSSNVLFSYTSSITLYALGSAVYSYLDENKRLNMLDKLETAPTSTSYGISIAGIEITKEIVQIAIILILAIIIGFYGLMWVVLKHHNKSLEAKIADTDKKTETVTNELNTLKEQQDGSTDTVKTFDLSAAKAEVIENNKKEIIYYNLLSFNIPRSTWITHFYTNSKGAVSISGKTSSTNNVYLFFKGIKSSVENSDLALTKLKYSTGFEDEIVKTNHVLYEFELSNAQYAALNNTVDETSASSNKGLSGALNQAQELIQQKIDDVKNAVKTEKTPDLPPIEDIKTNSDNKKNEKITKEDVDNIQKQREAKGAVKSSSKNKSENSTENTANPALPELPNLED